MSEERCEFPVTVKLGIMRKDDLTMAFIEQNGGKMEPMVVVPTEWLIGNPNKTAEREKLLADFAQRIMEEVAADQGNPMTKAVPLNPDGSYVQ